MDKLLSKVRASGLLTPTVAIGAIYLAGWFANGYWSMHFSCNDLLTFYGTFIIGNTAVHAIDSKWNSGLGQMPGKTDR